MLEMRGLAVIAIAIPLLTLSGAGTAMTSTNFAIPFGVVNAGAGTMSSTTFKLAVSSLGETVAGPTTGSGRVLVPGFVAQLHGTTLSCILDIDGDGEVAPLTDGLMILRSLFGLTGTSVTNGAVGAQATRTTWDMIQPMIHRIALDIDGNDKTEPLTDGLMLLRALFGLRGTAVTNAAIGSQATRADWTAIRAYLNGACGTTFLP